jgi:transcriptional regulator with XRE-family HTH domain
MKLLSPLDLAELDLSGVKEGRHIHTLQGMPLLWAKREAFGGWLLAQRKAARLSARAVAEKMGISHSLLVRLEAGDRVGPPPLTMLVDLAGIYRCDVRQVLHEAGYRLEAPDDTTATDEEHIQARFAAMVLHPQLRPRTLKAEALDYIPLHIKQLWIDYARNLARQPDCAELVAQALRSVK